MFRKIVSTVLTFSFFIMAITGVIMFFDKRLSHTLRLDPIHEILSLVLAIGGIVHFILNFKKFTSYLKQKSISLILGLLAGLSIIFFVIFMNMDLPDKRIEFERFRQGQGPNPQFEFND